MKTYSGNVVSFEIGTKGDSTTTTVILQVVFSDPDDIRPVEWIPAPGEDSVPLTGSRVIVHENSAGYLTSSGGNDGAIPVSEEGGKEIYSAAKGSSAVIKRARVRCLPNGIVEIISNDANGDPAALIEVKPDGTVIFLGGGDNAVRYSKLEEAFNQLKSDHNDLVATVKELTEAFNTGWIVNPSDGGQALKTILGGIADPSNSTADITPAKIDEIEVP